MTAHLFRDVAKQCPLELGGFDATEDSLVITVPEEITEAFTAALMAYANMTPSHLKTALARFNTTSGVKPWWLLPTRHKLQVNGLLDDSERWAVRSDQLYISNPVPKGPNLFNDVLRE